MAVEVTLRDGTRAYAWTLLPQDREPIRLAYEDLTPEAKRQRFLASVPHLTDSMLDHLVDDVDNLDHVAMVLFLMESDQVGVPAGIARMIRYDDDPTAADVAVTVAEEFRGRGVASALLDVLVHAARPEGVERIVTDVAADNGPSLAMLRRLGPTAIARETIGVLRVTVELPPLPDADPPAAAPRQEQRPPGARPGGSSRSSR